MPEFIKNSDGGMDWSKFFMAIAMAALFFFQGYNQMQHTETKNIQEVHHEEIQHIMTKQEILEMIELNNANTTHK